MHLFYLYFSNYPYLYGALTDEEINEILSKFKPNLSQNDLYKIDILTYNLLINITDNLASKVDNGLSILNDELELKILQRLLIEAHCSNEILYKGYNISKLNEYYQVKNYIRDIDFCLGKAILDIIINTCNNYPLKNEIYYLYLNKEKRFYFYKSYAVQAKKQNDNKIENEQVKAINKSIKYNDTIVLGNEKYHSLIKKMNLPCENIYYLNESKFSKFFIVPKKKKKFNKCNYFIIMNDKNGNEYIETIRYISNVFGIKIATIIYIQNKNIKINKKILQNPFIHTILTYSEKDILNYYYDNFNRLKELNITYFDENEALSTKYLKINYEFPKLSETKIIKEYDNGWDMIRNLNTNIFNICNVNKIFGYIDTAYFTKEMFKVYKENNCLDLFLNYYAIYLSSEYLVEQNTSLVCLVKMFLYAYTLEEKNGKSFYLLMNNDFRSGNPEKIGRYLPMINIIYKLLKKNHLKSYSGDVYRATWFKDELINEIKPGKKMLNASLWSSSKKLSVATKFLFAYKKNILLHTKVKEGNNIDIHLEKLSQFPDEEEILLLPFCFFEVKSFTKVKKNNLEYYDLELIYCEEENKNNKLKNIKSEDVTLNFIMK